MNRLFGNKRGGSTPELDDKIFDSSEASLNSTIKDLSLKLHNIEQQVTINTKQYKQNPKNTYMKKKLLNLLKQKQTISNQLMQYENSLMNVQQQKLNNMNVKTNLSIVANMQQQVKQMKQFNKTNNKLLNVDSIYDLKDELDDMMQQTDEINEILNMGNDQGIDEDDLNDELVFLMQENENSELALGAGSGSYLENLGILDDNQQEPDFLQEDEGDFKETNIVAE
ncbi:hypothetical protein QEN19_000193 [Hanseniaspora menglaensis]